MSKNNKNIGAVNVPEGCFPEDHERATAEILKACGKQITFLIPRRQPGFHTPDIAVNVLLYHTATKRRIKTLLIIKKNCEILVAKGKFLL